MSSCKRIFRIYKDHFAIALGMGIASALLGNLLHDLIVRFVPDDEMTVFPFGTLMVLFMSVLAMFLLSLFGAGIFHPLVSMGESRHTFFSDLFVSSALIFLGEELLAMLCYRFEKMKFHRMFPGLEESGDFSFLFSPLFCALYFAVGVCLTLLVQALILRYEKTALGILWILWLGGTLLFSKFLDALIDWYETVKDTMIPLLGLSGVMLICIVSFLVARRMILRQQVK